MAKPKNPKLAFLRLVKQELDKPLPPKEEPKKEPKKASKPEPTAFSAKPEWNPLLGPDPLLEALLEDKRQRLLEQARAREEKPSSEEFTLRMLELELDEARRNLAPREMRLRLEEEIRQLQARLRLRAEQDGIKGLSQELQNLLRQRWMALVQDFPSPKESKKPPAEEVRFGRASMLSLVEKFLSPEDHTSLTVVFEMAKEADSVDQFLLELESQLRSELEKHREHRQSRSRKRPKR